MTEPPITSPMTRRTAALSAQLVSNQKTVLRVTLGEVKWLYELEGLGTKLASDILKVILSGSDDDNEDQTYQLGEKVTNDHLDRFIQAALTAQVAECPNAAASARKWASKWIKQLEVQAGNEAESLQALMAADSNAQRKLPFEGEDDDDSSSYKKLSNAEHVQRLQKCAAEQKGLKDNAGYFETSPSLRLADLMVKHFHIVKHGSIVLPDVETLLKGGLAGPVLLGYDKWTSLLIGIVHMLYVVHCFKPPADVLYGQSDEDSPKYLEETVVDGVTKKEERKVYCSPSSVRALIRKIEHPLRMVKDLEERELLCKSFYNEMVSELNNIDRRTVTTVLFHLSKNSMALSDAQNSVQRTYTEQGKPSLKRERGATSSGGSSSARASSSPYSSQPSNACVRWLRGEKCKKVDPSYGFDCLRFDHLDRDFGKYPNAVYPTAANKGKNKKG